MREDERAGSDGHEGALFARVRLLQFGEGLDQFDGLGFFFDDVVDADAAGDDEDVVFF